VRTLRPKKICAGDAVFLRFAQFCKYSTALNRSFSVLETATSRFSILTALSAAPLDCGYSAELWQIRMPRLSANDLNSPESKAPPRSHQKNLGQPVNWKNVLHARASSLDVSDRTNCK
jgi:hypothetical protein